MLKFEQSVIANLMPISGLILGLYHWLFALETIGVKLNHHMMANIWEKAISILAGNLNLGSSCLITTVLTIEVWKCCTK